MLTRLNMSDIVPLNSTVVAAPVAPKQPATTPTVPRIMDYREKPFIFVCSHQELYLDKQRRPLSEDVILKKINAAFEASGFPWIKAIQFEKVQRVQPPKEKTFDPPRRLRLDVKTWRDRASLYTKDACQRDWLRLLEQQQPYGANIEATELRPRPLRAKRSGKRGGKKGELKAQQKPEQQPEQQPAQKTEQK
ncbi:hypothetical protein BO82DRAFT_362023 [Aspergillus uvarum CBS 121591]|uniref:Uncharacterized protein n=1 Tax=Aspergillus uvarum CBS 121591 TaxID=1448315 RepID=A0A319CKM7_9EURO|nr:hypothetical protein BO82DRAFT_362023 [Aspergillus uvarum CBS 121591]PYH85110.1 hypothetical protein BO82DRAFT_362023 [Aspergillus uvarum CBS 121591]